MEELDRARAKVRDAIKDLNKQLKSLKYWDEPCKSIVGITQSYHYLDKRVDLLIARSRVAEEIAKKTAEWGEKIKDDMGAKKIKTDIKLKEMVDTAKKSYMDEDHKHCDRSICIKI